MSNLLLTFVINDMFLPEFFNCAISKFMIMRALNSDTVKSLRASEIHYKPLMSPAAGNLFSFVNCCQNSLGKMSALVHN